MALITLAEYARRLGKSIPNLATQAKKGKFQTAVKMGRDWYIDEDEPYIDRRATSGGKYAGWRKYGRHCTKMNQPKKPEE